MSSVRWQGVARIALLAIVSAAASACATHSPAPAGIPARAIAERIAKAEPPAASARKVAVNATPRDRNRRVPGSFRLLMTGA